MRLSERLRAAMNTTHGYVDEDALRAIADELAALENEAAAAKNKVGWGAYDDVCEKLAKGQN